MKPRTKVPASLLRDLKRWAWDHDDGRAASELLLFDPATADGGRRDPARLADGLLRVSERLRRSLARSTRTCTTWLDGAMYPQRDATVSHASLTEAVARAAAEELATLALQRRVWRVVEALALAAKDGAR